MHLKLRHPLEATTRAARKAMNLKITGTFKTCDDCALAKDERLFIATYIQSVSTVESYNFWYFKIVPIMLGGIS